MGTPLPHTTAAPGWTRPGGVPAAVRAPPFTPQASSINCSQTLQPDTSSLDAPPACPACLPRLPASPACLPRRPACRYDLADWAALKSQFQIASEKGMSQAMFDVDLRVGGGVGRGVEGGGGRRLGLRGWMGRWVGGEYWMGVATAAACACCVRSPGSRCSNLLAAQLVGCPLLPLPLPLRLTCAPATPNPSLTCLCIPFV